MKGSNIMESIKGLTHKEVEEKIKQGKTNKVKKAIVKLKEGSSIELI